MSSTALFPIENFYLKWEQRLLLGQGDEEIALEHISGGWYQSRTLTPCTREKGR